MTLLEVTNSERVDGPTPHGGAYTVAYYADAEGNPAPKTRAARAEVHEFTEAGKRVHTAYAVLRGATVGDRQ
jgi:hypothetical protein